MLPFFSFINKLPANGSEEKQIIADLYFSSMFSEALKNRLKVGEVGSRKSREEAMAAQVKGDESLTQDSKVGMGKIGKILKIIIKRLIDSRGRAG